MLELGLLPPKAMLSLSVLQWPPKLKEDTAGPTANAIRFPDLEISKQERKQKKKRDGS